MPCCRVLPALSLVALGALLLAACPGDLGKPQSPSADGQVNSDTGGLGDRTSLDKLGAPSDSVDLGQKDSGGVSTLGCAGDCSDFVLDRILLPTTQTEAMAYGLSFGGKTYNAFGSLMVLLQSYVKSLSLQADVDLSVYEGKTLVLMRLKAKSLSTQANAKAQAWLGDRLTCCTSTSSLSSCKTEAYAKCFSGSAALDVANDSPKDMIFAGSITSGALSLGPSTLAIKLDVKTLGTMTLKLKQVQISGSVSTSGITSGVLSGAIPASEMDATVLPGIASLLDQTYKSSSTDQTTKDLIKNLLDANKDGTLTAAELKSNILLSGILAGDVDVDSDGKKDFSLGLGFTAVRCTITAP